MAALWLPCFSLAMFFVLSVNSNQTVGFSRRKFRDVQFEETSPFRLPTNLRPTFYNLTLKPVDRNTYRGTVRIYLDVERATGSIILNLYNESIDTSTLKVALASSLQKSDVTDIEEDGEHEMVTFRLNEPLLEQRGVLLTVSYTVKLPTNGGIGFYRVVARNYEDGTPIVGPQQSLVITKFEATYARRAFPCFDEPKFRTPFQLTVYHHPGEVSLFNAPILSSTPTDDGSWTVDVYEATPPLPTYLVCFGVTDYASASDGGQVRVFARGDVIDDMTFALSVAQPLLDALADYTGVPYPMPKMDMVAEPFRPGAMENWALVTFGEWRLKYKEGESGPLGRVGTVAIIAHEFAHHWFGGVVTLERWEYLWLNEGFATFLSQKITELCSQLYPEWGLPKDLVASTLVSLTLPMDVGKTRAMTSHIIDGHERRYFDFVSYKKAGAVLQMTEHFLTPKVWKAGLNTYLTQNMFQTVTPEKLFSALQESANEIGLYTVSETLQGWTRNPGYPLITVSRDSVTIDGKIRYRITQAPYKPLNKSANYTWNVPLTFTTDRKREFDPSKADLHWLYPSDPSTSELVVDTSGWVLFNINRIGLYRVNYDAEGWRKLKDLLLQEVTALPEVTRGQLVDDALYLAQSGHLNMAVAIDFLQVLTKEDKSDAGLWHFNSQKPWGVLYYFISRLSNKMGFEENLTEEEAERNRELMKAIRILSGVAPDSSETAASKEVES